MSEVLQWIIVGIIILASSVFLAKKLARSSKGECSECCRHKSSSDTTHSNCAGCDSADDFADRVQDSS